MSFNFGFNPFTGQLDIGGGSLETDPTSIHLNGDNDTSINARIDFPLGIRLYDNSFGAGNQKIVIGDATGGTGNGNAEIFLYDDGALRYLAMQPTNDTLGIGTGFLFTGGNSTGDGGFGNFAGGSSTSSGNGGDFLSSGGSGRGVGKRGGKAIFSGGLGIGSATYGYVEVGTLTGTTPKFSLSSVEAIESMLINKHFQVGGTTYLDGNTQALGTMSISGTSSGQLRVNASSTQVFDVDCSGLGVVTLGNSTTSWTYPNLPQHKVYGNLRLKSIPTGTGQLVPILEVDASDATIGNYPIKMYDVTVSGPSGLSPGDPRTYFDSIFGMNTISYVNISGSFTGTGDSFKILNPFETTAGAGVITLMCGVRSDILGAAVQIVSNGNTESYPLLLGINDGGGTPVANFAIDRDGSIYWGSVSGVTNIADSVQTYRAARPGSMGGGGMDVRLYRDAGSLRCNTDVILDTTLSVTSSITGGSDGASLVEFGGSLASAIVSPTGTSDCLSLKKQSTSSAIRGCLIQAEWNGSSASSNAIQGQNIFVSTSTSATGNLTGTNGLRANRATVRHKASGVTVTNAVAMSTAIIMDLSAGAITTAKSYVVESPSMQLGSSLTNYYGLYFDPVSVSGTLTNWYGIFIPSVTAGSNNYPIWLDSSATINFREAGCRIYSSGSKTMDYDVTSSGSHQFRVNASIEVSIAADVMTFNSGSDDPVFNWATDGQLRLTNGILAVEAGSNTTTYARVGGVMKTDTTAVGNVGTGEDDLITYSIPANTLAVNGDNIEFTMCGTMPTTLVNKRVRIKYGATTLLDTGALVNANGDWSVWGIIIRTGATTQKAICEWRSSFAGLTITVDYTTPAETLSGAVTLKATGEATSDNDVVQEMLEVKWYPGQ